MKKIIFHLHLIFIGIIGACDFNLSPKEMHQLYKNKKPPEPHSVLWFGKKIHYAYIDNAASTNLIFVHGSPGSWVNFSKHLADERLSQRANLISIDRLGFGDSYSQQAELSLKNHAAALATVIQKTSQKGQKNILIGHSYGGAVIARLAMDNPNLVSALVFLASSIDAKSEEIYWYNHFGKFILFRALIGKNLRNSNDEIVALKNELKLLKPLWKMLKVPVLVIHGKNDDLVPLAHGYFLRDLLQIRNNDSQFFFPESMGHFFIWSQIDYTIEKIAHFLDNLS